MTTSTLSRLKVKAAIGTFVSYTLVFLLGALTQPHMALAQQQSINGSIRGTITDPSNAPVPGVTVTVKNLDNGFARQATTSADGVYLAPNLPIGTYSVSTAASGFAPFSQTGIHLDAGTDATVDQQLRVGSVATEIQVASDAPIIETARFDLAAPSLQMRSRTFR